MKREKSSSKLITALLWLVSLLILIPVYMVVVNSFKDKASAAEMNLSFPKIFQAFENYSTMIVQGNIVTGFKNSAIVTVISVCLIVFIGAMTAYILQRRKNRLTGIFFTIIMLGLIFPVQIIPSYFICNFLQLPKYASAILILVVTNLPFAVITYMGFLKGISRQIDEAALIDGAGPFRVFFQIIFPLLQPVTITNIIVAFRAVWNDFGVTVYFLNNNKNSTLPLSIYTFFGNYNSDWQLVFANVVVTSLPVVILYLILQKHIISGMTAGSVKG